jgi:RsiW-degrading membrane proteinase PrsW (M82 family)
MLDAYFLAAIVLGGAPVLFWLWFWLREDRVHPEPYALVAVSFLSGAAIVPLVLPLQELAAQIYTGDTRMLVWVVIEEALKYLVALVVVLWNQAVDEPIDLIMYMIFVALGFAALENALFVYSPLLAGNYEEVLITGSFRFVGATLLHVVSSASLGIAMAFAFYRSNNIRLLYGSLGLFIAIVLHALFNFSIMNASGNTILFVFLLVWLAVVVLFLLFEKVKLMDVLR